MGCRYPLEAAYKKGEKPTIYKTGERPSPLAKGYEEISLPCGRCTSCRLEKSRQWAARIAHEAQYLWEEFDLPSTFITLTYDEAHYPMYGSLVPEHLQKFFKRFRRRIEPEKIRYYASGEYGSTCPKHEKENCPSCGPLQRPHYHAIVLGYGFPDRQNLGDRQGFPIYESNFLHELWPYGMHEIGVCTFESAGYCARYVMKKQTGRKVDEGHYTRYDPLLDRWDDVEPEFAHMSRNPGIGGGYYGKYHETLYSHDEMSIPGRGVVGKPCKYYDSIQELFDPEGMEVIKEVRRKAMQESLENGPNLISRAKVEDAKISKLRRRL